MRFFPFMFVASLRIRRQLARTPGCLRWASIIAGPRDFWTVTVWENRDKMLSFMRSDSHEDIMWEFGKWLRSFWLMRWRPTPHEAGSWQKMHLGTPPALPPPRTAETPEEEAALQAALDAIPHLKASAGPSGAAEYDYSPAARHRRHLVAGAVGATIRIEVPRLWAAPRAWRDLRALRARLRGHPDVLRCAVGVARPRELYALAILRDEHAADDFFGHADHLALADRWGDGYWGMRWQPDNEFGHWDGLRLRREKLGTAVRVPERAAAAARDNFRGGAWGRRKRPALKA